MNYFFLELKNLFIQFYKNSKPLNFSYNQKMNEKIIASPTGVQCEPFNFQLLLDDKLITRKKKHIFLTPQPQISKQSNDMSNFKIYEMEDAFAMKFNKAFEQINGPQPGSFKKEETNTSLKFNPFSNQVKSNGMSNGFSMWGPQQYTKQNTMSQSDIKPNKRPRKYSGQQEMIPSYYYSEQKYRNRINSTDVRGIGVSNLGKKDSLSRYVTQDL